MDASVGLEDIGPQRISYSKRDVAVFPLYFSRRPDRKRKKAKALGKGNRFHLVEMNPLDSFVPMLGIDMNLKFFAGHSSAQIDHVSFGSAFPSREIPNRCGKP
jgi:hypothetical protein